ncbi:DUF2726 domain-containing protein [Moraxella sp. ZY210820]|uniref:DUF2726 domain-containing protein n=1 Tax=unclassified Moraxella TaxID=2685852 RepID=UPI002730484F|nr:DUF2726 domain-containing protein [Moraxella sp. ZY210820]WLF83100.1 DUF2726 domain-containing protein [Moraxella sp. ZY210820]
MEIWIFAIIIVIVLVGIYFIVNVNKAKTPPFSRKALLNEEQKQLFILLKYHLPQHTIFTQIPLSNIITARESKINNLLMTQIVDFVIFDLNFNVIALIQLNPQTHAEQEKINVALQGVGYHFIHYEQVPTVQRLQQDFAHFRGQ